MRRVKPGGEIANDKIIDADEASRSQSLSDFN